jgi:Phosphotransferase enzyme family
MLAVNGYGDGSASSYDQRYPQSPDTDHELVLAGFLERLGVGALDWQRVSSFPGRSETWAGVTSAGVPVFVKRAAGEPRDVRRRLRRMEAMAGLLRDQRVLRTPRCLGIDEPARLAAFVLLEDAVTAAELVATGGFGADLAHEAGRMVGVLHGLTPPAVVADDRSEPAMPPTTGLTAIPLAAYAESSAAELQLWEIVHSDDELAGGIARLRERERRCARTLVHGDLRLDQLLHHNGLLYLVDWEECRLADPARDVGAFAGECLYRGVLGMASPVRDGDGSPTGRDALAGGVREFALLRPLIESFWDGYRRARPAAHDDPDLAVRAVAFAGWHMFDRVWAIAQQRARLSPMERAAAGVGRRALLSPHLLTETIGLGGDR